MVARKQLRHIITALMALIAVTAWAQPDNRIQIDQLQAAPGPNWIPVTKDDGDQIYQQLDTVFSNFETITTINPYLEGGDIVGFDYLNEAGDTTRIIVCGAENCGPVQLDTFTTGSYQALIAFDSCGRDTAYFLMGGGGGNTLQVAKVVDYRNTVTFDSSFFFNDYTATDTIQQVFDTTGQVYGNFTIEQINFGTGQVYIVPDFADPTQVYGVNSGDTLVGIHTIYYEATPYGVVVSVPTVSDNDGDKDPTNEIQDLQSVTDQGATTTNSITVGGLDITTVPTDTDGSATQLLLRDPITNEVEGADFIQIDEAADEVYIGGITDQGDYQLQINGNSYINGNLSIADTPAGNASTDSVLVKASDNQVKAVHPDDIGGGGSSDSIYIFQNYLSSNFNINGATDTLVDTWNTTPEYINSTAFSWSSNVLTIEETGMYEISIKMDMSSDVEVELQELNGTWSTIDRFHLERSVDFPTAGTRSVTALLQLSALTDLRIVATDNDVIDAGSLLGNSSVWTVKKVQ